MTQFPRHLDIKFGKTEVEMFSNNFAIVGHLGLFPFFTIRNAAMYIAFSVFSL